MRKCTNIKIISALLIVDIIFFYTVVLSGGSEIHNFLLLSLCESVAEGYPWLIRSSLSGFLVSLKRLATWRLRLPAVDPWGWLTPLLRRPV